MGKEFVNLVSTIITFRLLKAVSKTNLLDKMSFGDLIDDLGTAWGLTDSFNSENLKVQMINGFTLLTVL